MLAISLESRSIDTKYQSTWWYLALHAAGTVFGFGALVILLIGLNNGGLDPIFALLGWGLPGLVALAAAIDLLLMGQTVENEAKKRAAKEAAHQADLDQRSQLEQSLRGRLRLRFTHEGRRLRSLL